MANDLKPLKHRNGDLFVCDITDVILKDDLASMEHPFYSLSKKPDRETRRYEHNGNWIEFRPSVKGLPTIYDKDLIIYGVSQLCAAIDEGQAVPEWIEIDPYAYMIFTERGTGGRDYDALADSLDRLHGTNFRTNVVADGIRMDEWFGVIDGARIDTDDKTGKVQKIQIKFSEMVRRSVRSRKLLTLHPDYFRLTRPIDRRIYELARKHCGQQSTWSCYLKTLWKKSGSKSPLFEFRRMLKPTLANAAFPDYSLHLDPETDKVHFFNRNTMPLDKDIAEVRGRKDAQDILARLNPDINEKARKIAAGWDMHFVRDSFAAWWVKIGKPDTKNPDALFLQFCKTWQEKRGRP